MEDLSKHPNLLRRNGRYYFRIRVPLDIAATIGKKEIKKSLKTSDLREAKMQLRLEQLKAEDLFHKARQRTTPPKTTSPLLSLIDIERNIAIWQQNLERYISSIGDYLSNEINRYHSGDFILRTFEPYHSLKSIETYWDIKCDNPVTKIKPLERDFLTLGNNTSTSYYNDAGTLTEASAITLMAEFKTKQRLKVRQD